MVLIPSNSNDRRSSRRYESALEPHPGLSVSLASRGSRPDHRSARAARHDPRRDPPRGAGRPPDDRRTLARAFVAKAVLGVPTTTALIERLDVDKSLRRILGW